MSGILFPGDDRQCCPPVGECARCHNEVYNLDCELCPECEAEIRGTDIVVKYAEAWPRRLMKFLWDEKDEDYMKQFLAAFRDYCQGTEPEGPDMEGWAMS